MIRRRLHRQRDVLLYFHGSRGVLGAVEDAVAPGGRAVRGPEILAPRFSLSLSSFPSRWCDLGDSVRPAVGFAHLDGLDAVRCAFLRGRRVLICWGKGYRMLDEVMEGFACGFLAGELVVR